MRKLTTFLRTATRGVLPLILLAVGTTWIGIQERALWQRAPAESTNRYVLDRLQPDIPGRVDPDDLWQLCTDRRSSRLWRSRQSLAACLADPPVTFDEKTLSLLEQGWRDQLDLQGHFASQVAAISHGELVSELSRMRDMHRHLQEHSGGPVIHFLASLGVPIPRAQLAHDIGNDRQIDIDALNQSFFGNRKATQLRLGQANRIDHAWTRARDIGLLATGLRLDFAHAAAVPQPFLVADRSSLAERIEWTRRAKPRSGDRLESTLTGWLDMLSLSSFLAVGLAILLRASPFLVAQAFLLAMLGSLHLLDVSLTGPPALRYLPVRNLGEGFWNLWGLGSPQLKVQFWGPALVFMLALGSTRALTQWPWLTRKAERILRYPLSAWGAVLLTGFAATLLASIGSASKTELLGAWAAIATALFVSRYGPLIRHGIKPATLTLYAAPVVVAALLASMGGGLLRMDLGAFGIALLIAAIVVLVMARSHWIRIVLAAAVLIGLYIYSTFLKAGEDVTGLIGLLPQHAQQRFLSAHNAAAHGAPDVQQVEWLLRSAQRPGDLGTGWGIGNVPWQGLPGSTGAHTLPLPAVSDLALVLPAASEGLLYAFVLVGLLGWILISVIATGYTQSVEDDVLLTRRFLASAGAFGLLIALLRVVLNLGGTLQVLPLTGVPLVFLAHAPAAGTFVLFYLGLVLGACHKNSNRPIP
jgi:cell division protein FtsW (lipid II flippase)